MRTKTSEELAALQRNPKNIRNICILAHVDHGKTTLADAMIASNGIISSRMAGKLRYMDSLEQEQTRGITMKSSAIALHFNNQANENFLINLIDSPGHVDFSSEVSTAVRLRDGALVVVDVVEGVCPQTHAVLRQAWLENIKPCLVLNKMDRLISELKFTPDEAYIHLQQILEQVNVITSELFTSVVLEKMSEGVTANDKTEGDEDIIEDCSSGLHETDDSHIYFSPDQGNVVFASAVDSWGFRVSDFSEMYASKMQFKKEVLDKTLWGDYYLHNKTKKIFKGAQEKAKRCLFVQLVLDPLWKVYEAVVIRRDKMKAEQITNSLNIKVSVRDARQSDPRVYLKAITSQWLPLSKAVLNMVTEKLPSPLEMQADRVESLMCSGLRTFESLPKATQQLKQAFLDCCSSEEAPLIVFVSKMFPVDEQSLPKNKYRPLTSEELARRRQEVREKYAEMTVKNEDTSSTPDTNSESAFTDSATMEYIPEQVEEDASTAAKTHFMAFARVYSGTLRKGQQVFVLGPKYHPGQKDANKPLVSDQQESTSKQTEESDSEEHISVFSVEDLYLLMGRELETLETVPAGNVLGMGGLDELILKSATISNTTSCPPFTAMHFEARPIVRVAIEPSLPRYLPQLVRGLKLLNQADPCVEVHVQETGEHVITAAGEIHLQRCIEDLKRYAGVPFDISSPIIPFRETIIPPPKIDMVNEVIEDYRAKQKLTIWMSAIINTGRYSLIGNKKRTIEIQTANKKCTFLISAQPLPEGVVQLLDKNAKCIRALSVLTQNLTTSEKTQLQEDLDELTWKDVEDFKKALREAFNQAGGQWSAVFDKILSFGPRRTGPNILINKIPGYNRASIWQMAEGNEDSSINQKFSILSENESSVINGFQMATLAGPLCEEPMMGVCFVLEDFVVETDGKEARNGQQERTEAGINKNLPSHSKSEDVDCPVEELRKENVNIEKEAQHGIQGISKESEESQEVDNKGEGDIEEADNNEKTIDSRVRHLYGPLSGQIMAAVKDGCRFAFLQQPMRLMAAMYTCCIQATADVLGRMYAVVSKREGRVLWEDRREGANIFEINAVFPVAESFGFAEEIRKKTSGLANPQLVFSHWEVIDIDPFWVPTTEEEYAHYGEKADYENQAAKYMNTVRKRKGLAVEMKTVQHAEKQRTLMKKK